MMATWHGEMAVVAVALVGSAQLSGGRGVDFLASRAWPALVGCGVFLLYPAWRRLWRRWHPLAPATGSLP